MAKVNFVKKAAKAYPDHGIKKGDPYWWWKPRYGVKKFFKSHPRPSQVTGSEFLSRVYGIEEDMADLTVEDLAETGAEDTIEDIKGQIEEIKDEEEDKINNMEESGLDQSPTGELIQSRIDSLEEWINELDGVDVDQDLEEVLEEIQSADYSGE